MIKNRNNDLKRLRVVSILFLLTAALPAVVLSYEKKKNWEQTFKANPVGGERVVDGWHTFGPLHTRTILWKNPYPPEQTVDPGAEVEHNGKKIKWKKQSLRKGYLRIYSKKRGERFAFTDLAWSKPEPVLFRIHASDVRYIRINGKQVWEWDYITNNERSVIRVDLQRKNRIFLKMSSHWHAYLRITYCSKRVARERAELLLYLCEEFSDEHQRIVEAAKEICRYLETYGRNLAPAFRKRVFKRLKTALEKSLRASVSAERVSYYLDFCSRTGAQPTRAKQLISKCPEKNRPGLLFKLARLYITSFGSLARGWNLFRDIMRQPETAKSLAGALYRFCADHGYYLEGAERLSSIAETIAPEKRIGFLSRLSALYRRAGETEKALEHYEKIKDRGKEGDGDDKEKNKEVKRARSYISSLFRMINKENVCILPQAIGFVNSLAYVGKLAENGQTDKAYTELTGLIKKSGFNIVDTGSETPVGTMATIEKAMQSWPVEFRKTINRKMREKTAAALRETDSADHRSLGKLWHTSRISPATAPLFVPHAEQLLTKGKVHSAACWYERILQRNPDPLLYLSCAYALYLCGDSARAQNLKNRLNKQTRSARVRFRGKESDLGSALAALSKEFTSKQAPVPVRAPSVKAWSDRVSPEDRILCRADNAYPGYVSPPCVPVRKGNTLYVYTGVVLRAYDIRTGTRRWSVRVRGGKRILTESPVPVFRMQVCGDRVYVRVPGNDYELKAYSCSSGKEVWSSRREPGLGGLHIASEPAWVSGMIVFTAALNHRWGRTVFSTELFAAAVRADTGDLVWKQLLVAGDSDYGNEDLSRHLPRALKTDHGIFIQTSRKVFQMLDPISGAVEWAIRYRRSAEQDSRYTLYENTVAAHGNSVVAAPRDSSYVYCLDIQKGRVRWITSKGLSPVLCGIYKGSAVLLGRNLRLIDTDSGNVVKSTRLFRRNHFPLPFLSGKRLWVSYPSSTLLVDLETMRKADSAAVLERTRLFPVPGAAVEENADHITVYGYSRDDFDLEAVHAAQQKKRIVPGAENCMGLRKVMNGRRKIPASGHSPETLSGTVRPVLWWMKPMDMERCGGVRGGTELFVWSKGCVRLIETERFGETLWERSFDPSGFHVKHVQNIGNNVLVCGSRDVSCLDIASGRERWRVRMPMYVRSLHYRDGKAFLYSHKSGSRSYRWRTDVLNIKDGTITRFSTGNKHRVPVVWDNDNRMLFREQKGVYVIDVHKRRRLWKREMETRWFKSACFIHNSPDTDSVLYMKRGEDLMIMEPDTGTLQYKTKEWELFPWMWEAYGEPYAYFKNRVMRYKWNRKKKKLEKKWHTAIKDLDDRRMTSYCIVGDNFAVFSHAGDHYIELTQLDRDTGKIKRRDKLIQVSGGYHRLDHPRWVGNRLYALSDRMLYCFRFPVNPKALANENAQRKKMLGDSFNRGSRTRSIRMHEISSRGLRPSLNLTQNKRILNTREQWFPSDIRDISRWKGPQDASFTVDGITPEYTLRLQVNVNDDTWIPYTGDHYSGDRLILTTGKHTAHIGMNADLEPVVRGINRRYIGNFSCQILETGAIQYMMEFNLHPHHFSMYHHSRHAKESRLSVGVRYVDDDGSGIKGTLAWPHPDEWGVMTFRRK